MYRKTIWQKTSLISVMFLTPFAVALGAEAPAAAKDGAPRAPETLKVQTSESDEAGTLPEKIDVQAMKRRYWTVGNEDLMDVVQNRLYTKKGRIELAGRYGFYSDDPFMSMKTAGVSAGYHLNEFLSLHGFYASVSSSESSAFKAARRDGYLPVVNAPKSLMGAEARLSLIYGKLSLLGKKIIYYDFNVAGGAARFTTDNGDSPMGMFLGLGQQIYVTRHFFITLDYRLMRHSERFRTNENRTLTTNWIQVGLGAFLL